jgi:hypothetical protein
MATTGRSRLTSKKNYTKGSEFGGVDGMIQPLPHGTETLPSHETLKLVYQTDKEAGAIKYRDGSTVEDDQPIPETKRIR